MAAVAAMNWSKNGSAMVFVDRQNREKTLGTYLVNSVSRKRVFSTDQLTGKLLTCTCLSSSMNALPRNQSSAAPDTPAVRTL